jgi:hypothetical protein
MRAEVSGLGAAVAQRLLHPTTRYPILAVEAFGVDLEQHLYRVAGHSATWVAGTPPLSHVDTQAWRKAYGVRPSGDE